MNPFKNYLYTTTKSQVRDDIQTLVILLFLVAGIIFLSGMRGTANADNEAIKIETHKHCSCMDRYPDAYYDMDAPRGFYWSETFEVAPDGATDFCGSLNAFLPIPDQFDADRVQILYIQDGDTLTIYGTN